MLKKISRGSALVGLLAALVLPMSLPRQAWAGLTGSWSCFGNINFNTSNIPYSELIHLGSLNADGRATGFLFYNFSTEVCKIPVTAAIAVDATGVGTMKLTFTPSGTDLDNDYKCSNVFGRSTTLTETYIITTAGGGKKFFFIGGDDSITPSTKDSGDFFVPAGVCEQQ